jgi:ArsR family transcriptional regulator
MRPESLFKALSDLTRLRCVILLAERGELCVCELTHALQLPQPKVSHHLANLRRAGLVSDRKQGLWIYYRINPDLPQWVGEIVQTTMMGNKQEIPFDTDADALDSMRENSGVGCTA